MSKDNEFEDFLRNEFEKNPIEYKEEYWLQAEKLIVENEKKERRKLFIYVSSAAALLCIIAGLYCIKNKSSLSSIKTNTPENTINEKYSNDKKSENNYHANNEIINKNNYSIFSPINDNDDKKEIVSNNKIIKNEKHKNNLVITKHINKEFLTSSINTLNKPKIHKSKTQQLISANIQTNNSQKIISLDENNMTLYTDEMIIIPSTFSEGSISMDCIRFNDFENIKASEIKKKPTIQYYLIAGAGAYNGFGNESGFTMQPIAGIGVSYSLSEKFNADFNILYIERGEVNASKQFYSELYDFGYSNETKIITTSKIKYITIPIFLKYTFRKRQSLIAGISLGHLLSSDNNLRKITVNDNGNIITDNSKETNYVNGIKKYDFGIIAGFQSQLFKNLNANIQLDYGLVDVTKNTYYTNDSRDFNISIDLTFRYTIFRK